jgi:hypothetical protein
MTQRDQKTLLMLVLGVGGVGVAFWLLYTYFLSPLALYKSQITSLEDDVDAKEQQVTGVKRDRLLVQKARTHSLSASQVKASNDYDKYLSTLLQISGLTEVDVTDPPPPVDAKAGIGAAVAAPNAPKKPAHTVLTYTVHAKGTMASVVNALENLQKTPVLHRVRNMELGRRNIAKDLTKDDLTVSMSVEAMIVAGTKLGEEVKLEPNSVLKLPTESYPRTYADMARKNIFIGLMTRGDNGESNSIDSIIPEYVRLVLTDPTSGEAFLRNLLFRTIETRLRDKKGGFNKFQIRSEDGSKVLVSATVLRIDQRDVYFQVGEDVHGIHIGDTVTHAMRHVLSDAELSELKLNDLVLPYDPKTDTGTNDSLKKGSKGAKKRS